MQQEEAIRRLAFAGFGPAQIHRELDRLGLYKDFPLSGRTIERKVREFAPLDASGPWSLREENSDDVPLMLDVLVDTYEATEGRVWLTKDQADWVIRLRKAVPDLPSNYAYWVSRLYQALGERGDTRVLDLFIGFKPWQSRDSLERWATILQSEPTGSSADSIVRILNDMPDDANPAKALAESRLPSGKSAGHRNNEVGS